MVQTLAHRQIPIFLSSDGDLKEGRAVSIFRSQTAAQSIICLSILPIRKRRASLDPKPGLRYEEQHNKERDRLEYAPELFSCREVICRASCRSNSSWQL